MFILLAFGSKVPLSRLRGKCGDERRRLGSISYLKANAAEVLQETLALLKILALGSQQVERGEITPIGEVAGRLRAKVTDP